VATRIDGDYITVPGQVSVAGAATSPTHVATIKTTGSLRAYTQYLDLNPAAPAPVDLATIAVPSTRFIPLRCWICNPTANLSSATLGLYTGAGGTGTAIILPVLLASLTALDTFQELTIAALASVITDATLYPYLTVAAGVAGTADLILELQDLSHLV
jgi:hypothetical protein